LVTSGNALLTPLAPSTQPLTAGIPADATAANVSLTNASGTEQPIGAAVLSRSAESGSLASVNLASGGQPATVSVLPSGVDGALATTGSTLGGSSQLAPATAAGLPVSATVASQPLTGGGTAQPIGVSALSPTTANGTVLNADAVSGNQLLSVSSPKASDLTAGTNALAGNTAGATTGTLGALQSGSGSLANVTIDHTPIVTGSDPALGVSAVSPTQNTGSLLTAGIASASEPVTLGMGGNTILPKQ
jgi:hypothetical protein